MASREPKLRDSVLVHFRASPAIGFAHRPVSRSTAEADAGRSAPFSRDDVASGGTFASAVNGQVFGLHSPLLAFLDGAAGNLEVDRLLAHGAGPNLHCLVKLDGLPVVSHVTEAGKLQHSPVASECRVKPCNFAGVPFKDHWLPQVKLVAYRLG